jgi:hypothetical protein
MGLFRTRERVPLETLLDLAPGRAPGAEWEDADGEVRIRVRRADGPAVRLLAKFFTLPAERTVVLDRDGADVWRWADGSTRVRDMARRMADAHGWPEDRAREAVIRFLGMLSERRLIGFAGTP